MTNPGELGDEQNLGCYLHQPRLQAVDARTVAKVCTLGGHVDIDLGSTVKCVTGYTGQVV